MLESIHIGSSASNTTRAINSFIQFSFSEVVMNLHRPTACGFLPAAIFIRSMPLRTPMSPVIVMNIPWSFDAGTPLGAIFMIAVTLMLMSEPLARPMPFTWAVHEYSEITPCMSTDLMEPCPALLPFPSQSFSPNTIFLTPEYGIVGVST